MPVSYHASRGCADLNNYSTNVRLTSVKSNREHENKEDQISLMLEEYKNNPNGITDDEMRIVLKEKGHKLPNSTISARRNDINDKHLSFCETNGFNSHTFIISNNKKNNPTPPYRLAMLWVINPLVEGDFN